MKNLIITLAIALALVPATYVGAARSVGFDIPNTTYGVDVLVSTGVKGGNRVLVIRCDSSEGSRTQTFQLSQSGKLAITTGFHSPPWPAPGVISGTDDTGMLCSATAGSLKGNGSIQEFASDCFWVTVEGTMPEPALC